MTTIIEAKKLRLQDLLTVDANDVIIKIKDEHSKYSTQLIQNAEVFFEEIYADVLPEGITLIKEDSKEKLSFEEFLSFLDNSKTSCLVLIEGFAGCGKSTLVQKILQKQLNTFSFDSSLYNYNLEVQNDIAIRDEKGKIVRQSSINNAIIITFIELFVQKIKENKQVLSTFNSLLEECENFIPFNSLFHDFYNTDTYQDVQAHIERYFQTNNEKDINCVKRLLRSQLKMVTKTICIFAIDYLLRISLYVNKEINNLYLCYDNLDAIEDASDLKGFDDKLKCFRAILDDFIDDLNNKNYFRNLPVPRFIMIATYRKITARMAEIEKHLYQEVKLDPVPDERLKESIFIVDATTTFSYKDIVTKRKNYFEKRLKRFSGLSIEKRNKLISDFASWNTLNQSLEIMNDKYSSMWNKNYRTCSFIADHLYSKTKYDFQNVAKFISESKSNDGYSSTNDINGDSVLCSHYGGSAILLSSVCKVFNENNIWNDFLDLSQLDDTPKKDKTLSADNASSHSFKNVSLSRLILTYIYNKNEPVSLKELYDVFCKTELFPYTKLCLILSKMLARNKGGLWRRPLYYADECILSENADVINSVLTKECQSFKHFESGHSNFTFLICDSGKMYVQYLMQEFEFFSNRLNNDNKALYLYTDMAEISKIISSVYNAVCNCCENMEDFRKKYMEVTQISVSDYLNLHIHPTTNIKRSPQLHTERIIFSHIAYLNKVRLYFIDESITPVLRDRKKINELFVNHILDYIQLYNTSILPITQKREYVANSLLDITNSIIAEGKKDFADLKILFKSISLY